MKELLTIGETAQRLGVSEATLYRWKKSQGLPFIRVGQFVRIPLDRLEAWLDSHLTTATAL